jgi:hypothetical protein
LGSDIDPHRNRECIKEEDNIEKGDFYKIGCRKEVSEDVGKKINENEQRRKGLR